MGQILRNSKFGECIYNLSTIKEFKNYVESGTYDGEGSTKCFIDALIQRLDSSCLYSLEANKEFYEKSSNFWSSTMMMLRIPKLHLIYGRIIEIEELISEEEVEKRDFEKHYPYLDWRRRNISEYKQCKNVIEKIPREIDVLLLDGGVFSTRAEWERLKNRTKVVLLDDIKTLKTKSIKDEILLDKSWKLLYNIENDRNGFFIACKNEYYGLVKHI